MKNKKENENKSKDELQDEEGKIADYLEKLRFRRQFFGGVSEQDVWKKINELNELYQEALKIQAIKYETKLELYKNPMEDSRNGEIAHD